MNPFIGSLQAGQTIEVEIKTADISLGVEKLTGKDTEEKLSGEGDDG